MSSNQALLRQHFKELETSTNTRLDNLHEETKERFIQDLEQFREINDRLTDIDRSLEEKFEVLDSNTNQIEKNFSHIEKIHADIMSLKNLTLKLENTKADK